MRIERFPNTHSESPNTSAGYSPCTKALFSFCLIFFALVLNNHAAVLTWDANGPSATPPNPADGSGTWHTANAWWNGTADVNWADTANDAVFGAGVAGNYTVTNDTASIAANLRFTNAGSYTIVGTSHLPVQYLI